MIFFVVFCWNDARSFNHGHEVNDSFLLDELASWSFDDAIKSIMILFCSWYAFANCIFANDIGWSFGNGIVIGGDDSSLSVKCA